MKRLWSIVLCAVLLAATAAQGQFTYSVNTDGTSVTITKYTGFALNLNIPGTIDGLIVTSIGSNSFWGSYPTAVTIPGSVTNIGDFAFYESSLTNVTIPEGVVSIGKNAFDYSTTLASVSISASVMSIGSNAFNDCDDLIAITVSSSNAFYSSVNGVLFDRNQSTLLQFPGGAGGSYTVPSGVANIGAGSFNYNSKLTNITFPDSVTNVGDDAFISCWDLATVTLGDGVSSIGMEAFAFCPLTDVTIPDGVTTIGKEAFAISSLTNITISDSVTTIGDHAFIGTLLRRVTIPAGVTNIGADAFGGCSELMVITVDTNNAFYSSLDGVLLDKGRDTFLQYPGGFGVNYTIPDSITTIGEGAFSASDIVNLMIGNNVTSIGAGAFGACHTITNITIPDSVTNMGDYAFSDCNALTNFVIPTSISSIGNGVFQDCWSLTNITIPNSVTNIGTEAFWDCLVLSSVTIPGTVTSIGENAFGTGVLTGVYFTGNAPEVNTNIGGGPVYYLPGTSGWAAFSSNSGSQTVLWNPGIQAGGAHFGFSGGQFGFDITNNAKLSVVVEYCTNISSPVWMPLRTVTLTNGSFHFTDPVQDDGTGRFYALGLPQGGSLPPASESLGP